MEKIALITGKGKLPYYFYKSAIKNNYEIYPIGLFEDINENIKSANNFFSINIGELGKLIFYLEKNNIKKIMILGKVEKSLLFKDIQVDETFEKLLKRLPNNKDATILFGIMGLLKLKGIKLLPQNFLMDNLLAKEKTYTNRTPDIQDKKTIDLGIEAAMALTKLDIGQTIVAKDKSVVALESLEGTDETIKRAGNYAGENTIIIKMARPKQDMRVDVPTIGMETLERAKEIKAKGIIVEAGKVLVLEEDELIKKANEYNIFIVGVRKSGLFCFCWRSIRRYASFLCNKKH